MAASGLLILVEALSSSVEESSHIRVQCPARPWRGSGDEPPRSIQSRCKHGLTGSGGVSQVGSLSGSEPPEPRRRSGPANPSPDGRTPDSRGRGCRRSWRSWPRRSPGDCRPGRPSISMTTLCGMRSGRARSATSCRSSVRWPSWADPSSPASRETPGTAARGRSARIENRVLGDFRVLARGWPRRDGDRLRGRATLAGPPGRPESPPAGRSHGSEGPAAVPARAQAAASAPTPRDRAGLRGGGSLGDVPYYAMHSYRRGQSRPS